MDVDLRRGIAETASLTGAGALGVRPASHARGRGRTGDTRTCRIGYDDPSWFQQPSDRRAGLQARLDRPKP
jgi:hypothetical protein